MIISCEKCNKKFEISDELIPDSGRLLQCGSCSHKWHFNRSSVAEPKKKINIKKDISKKETNINEFEATKNINFDKRKKSVGFLNIILILIITFIAAIIFLDTFKSYIPNMNIYLDSLYESLKDIFLFFKDLVK